VRYVVDCSVAVRWFVAQSGWQVAALVLERFGRGDIGLLAPDVIVPEFGHVMRKLVVGRKLGPEKGRASLDRFLALPIVMTPARALARPALDLAFEHSGTFYDALYVALAEREDVKILTADERMASAFAPLERTVSLATFK
jgi:predicted nucleic acid-binding protein